MFKFVILSALVALSVAQRENYHQNSQQAAIISEQRYLSGDGKFGAAYTQEDGINFKEETDADGTRHGSYSYVDPSGQRRTISYTAGKNGFQASGDHLPVAPPAPPQPIPQPQYEPQPRYQPQPAPQNYNNGNNNYDSDGQYDPRYNDPSFSQNQQSYQPPAPQQQFHHQQPSPPQPPPQQQHQFHHHQPAAPQFNHNFQHQPAPQHEFTTQNPHRFQPPGKLSLNRTPDGFSYSFNKV